MDDSTWPSEDGRQPGDESVAASGEPAVTAAEPPTEPADVPDGENGPEWFIHRVGDSVPLGGGALPLGDCLVEREQRLRIAPGRPLLLRRGGWPDRDVLAYLNTGAFPRLALQSQLSYATDLKVFLNFLASQGRDWRDASDDDICDFENWRRRDPSNPRRVTGTTFARGLAALNHYYKFQVGRGVIERSPIAVDEVRRRDGSTTFAPRLRPSNIRRHRVKWLTPGAYRRWRDIGLGGYGADGVRDASWRGRNDTRNIAFADLLWASGLRLREGATLLGWELPASCGGGGAVRSRVGEDVAKGGGRDFWVDERALRGIEAYRDSARAAAVRRAQSEGRYARLAGVVVAQAVTRNRQVVLASGGGRDRVPLDALTAEDRRRLFVEVEGGLEPAMLWLTESGMPMPYDTWKKVFSVASVRCAAQGVAINCHAHMLRHSFALRMLVTLMHALDRRFGLTPQQRQEYRELYGDPYVYVQTLLGHRSRDTTEAIYLEPVKSVAVELFLNGDEDRESASAVLSRIAESSDRVLDDPR